VVLSYWLMSITALFATAGATNASLYPTPGLPEWLAEAGQSPPLMARSSARGYRPGCCSRR
jgi:hypothetical protein